MAGDTITVDPEVLASLRESYGGLRERASGLVTRVNTGNLDPSFGLFLNSIKPYYTAAKDSTRSTLQLISQLMTSMENILQTYEADVAQQEDEIAALLREILAKIEEIADNTSGGNSGGGTGGGGTGGGTGGGSYAGGTGGGSYGGGTGGGGTGGGGGGGTGGGTTTVTPPAAPTVQDPPPEQPAQNGDDSNDSGGKGTDDTDSDHTGTDGTGDGTQEQPPLTQEELAEIREFLAERQKYLDRIHEEAERAFWEDMSANDVLGRTADELREAYENREGIYFEDLFDDGDLFTPHIPAYPMDSIKPAVFTPNPFTFK